jgi:uncharacterized membrane protein YgdD (TMEM256/DUF423 family)
MLAIALVLAAAMGAGGVILAAASAHLAAGAGLESAAYMLLFHATAILGAAVALEQRLLLRPLAGVALAAWILGGALFSGDLALRAFAGHRLFPMAAPSGGTLLIGGWVLLAIAAGLARRRVK